MSLLKRQAALGVLLAAGFLAGCATTTLQSVQRAPGYKFDSIHRVLVVCVTSTPGLRGLLESDFVLEWKKRGVDAVASDPILPAGVALDKADIESFAKAQKFDAVLVTRLLKREQIEPETPDDSNLTQDVKAIVASPEYGTDFEVAVVRSNLYDVATEKRVWSGISQTLLTEDVTKRVSRYVKLILKNIYTF
jgi:hypothetical protein